MMSIAQGNMADPLEYTRIQDYLHIDSLIDYIRDMTVIKSTSIENKLLILTAEERKKISALADKFDVPALIYSITALEKIRWSIKNSDNPRALLEALMLRLALSEQFLAVPQLLARLNAPSAGTRANNELVDHRPLPEHSSSSMM